MTGCSEIGYSKLNKTMLKFIQKHKRSRVASKIVKVLINAEEQALPDIKMYFEALAIKVWCLRRKMLAASQEMESEKSQTHVSILNMIKVDFYILQGKDEL